MCGIFLFLDKEKTFSSENVFSNFLLVKHRGPDNSDFKIIKDLYVGFHRLSITDTSSNSNQPFVIQEENSNFLLICNGEIYNYTELIEEYSLELKKPYSDCLVLLHLYLKFDIKNFTDILESKVKGEFAFIICEIDKSGNIIKIISGRDTLGVRPLYTTRSFKGMCSEIKGIHFINEKIIEHPCGNVVVNNISKEEILFYDYKKIYLTKSLDLNPFDYFYFIKNSLVESVKIRLSADRPIGFLLSGGLDSSLICGIASKLLGKIRTFSIGMENSTDLIYAQKVADFIGSDHTVIKFNKGDVLNCIEEVIKTVETYDITSIRASIPQYLISKWISENTDIKVLLVGECSDEVTSGYLFNHFVPENKIQEICEKYTKELHIFDIKRCDRCISRFGMEARLPFSDSDFIKNYWKIPQELRHPKCNYLERCIEKKFLREAFRESGILPEDVLYRRKEAFSDGVSGTSNSLHSFIKNHFDTNFPYIKGINDSPTIESTYYKFVFDKFFYGRSDILPHYWQPSYISEENEFIDPSARELKF
ncbi:MAG TPA: asparagine synthase-related protein [Allocoleopsis sp.]